MKLDFPLQNLNGQKSHNYFNDTLILFPIRDEVVQNMCEHRGLNQQIYTVHVII
jgi:hypothetical protein